MFSDPVFPRSLKILLTISPVLLLSSCGLPTPVSVLSFAADGISYAASGRSVSDHALSVAADQDCAMIRLIKGEWMCRDFKKGEETDLVLEAREWVAGPEVVGLVDPDGRDEEGNLVARPNAVAAAPAPAPAQVVVTAAPDTVSDSTLTIRPATAVASATPTPSVPGAIVVGSFGRPQNARALARRLASLNPMIVGVRIGSRLFHRVVIRPATADGAIRYRARLREMGITGHWIAPGCPAHVSGFCNARIALGINGNG